jgi:hypothetical protein
MATTTPFTYNDGTYIPGTEQIGDLAVGLVLQDYSRNPGGEKWWMGPDEDDRYVIGKDVPTEDWPTQIPEGDIGSVRFWATSTESDSEFIVLTNRVGSQSFTTISECLNWINTNGYWTNYPNPPAPAPRDCKISFRIQPLPNFTRIATAGGMMIYNPTLEEMYVGISYWEDSYTTYTPGYLDVDNVAASSAIYISRSESPNQGYFTTSATITDIPGSGNMWFDESYQLLYTMGMVEKSANGEKHRVAKYSVSDKEVKMISSKIGPSPEDYTTTWITGLSNLGLVYVSHYTGSEFYKDHKIESYYTSSLTLKDTYLIEAGIYGTEGLHALASNPNNNTILAIGTDRDQDIIKSMLFNGSNLSLISTNTYANTAPGGPQGYDGAIYIPETDCFYFRTARQNEPPGPRKKSDGLLLVINSDNTTNAIIDLGGGDGSGAIFNSGGLAYDTKRNVIWTSVLNYNRISNTDTWFIIAVDILGNKVVKTLPQPQDLMNSSGQGIAARNFGIDVKNDKLYISDHSNQVYTIGNVMVWDLDDLWNTTV